MHLGKLDLLLDSVPELPFQLQAGGRSTNRTSRGGAMDVNSKQLFKYAGDCMREPGVFMEQSHRGVSVRPELNRGGSQSVGGLKLVPALNPRAAVVASAQMHMELAGDRPWQRRDRDLGSLPGTCRDHPDHRPKLPPSQQNRREKRPRGNDSTKRQNRPGRVVLKCPVTWGRVQGSDTYSIGPQEGFSDLEFRMQLSGYKRCGPSTSIIVAI
jgi:hypothetical protein